MQNSKKLYELMATLSKSEKIYLKKVAFAHGRKKDNIYLVLFDLIEKKGIVSDEQLLKAIKKEPLSKNLPSVKHYLYHHILRSLRNFHHTESVGMEVKNMLADIYILMNRGLFSQCKSLITSTKKVALKYNMHIDYLNLLKIETKLFVVSHADESIIDRAYEEQRDVTKIIINSIDYNEAYSRSWNLLYGKSVIADKQKSANFLIDHPLLTNIEKARTFYDKSNFYLSNSYVSSFIGNEKKRLENLKENLALWDSKPHLVKENINDYIVLLHYLTFSDVERYDINKINFISSVISKIKKLSSNSIYIQALIFQSSAMAQQDLYINQGKFEDGRKHISEVERGMKKFDSLINNDIKLVFYFNNAYIYFACNEYKAALIWLNRRFEIGNKAKLSNLVLVFKILHLIIHLELDHFDLIESSFRSLSRKLVKSTPKTFVLLLDFIKEYYYAKNHETKREQLLVAAIQNLNGISNNVVDKRILNIFDFISYLESKLYGKTFAQVYKGKVKSNIATVL